MVEIDECKKGRQKLEMGRVVYLCKYLWRLDCEWFGRDPFEKLTKNFVLLYSSGVRKESESNSNIN